MKSIYQDFCRAKRCYGLIRKLFSKARQRYEASNILERWLLARFNGRPPNLRKLVNQCLDKGLLNSKAAKKLVRKFKHYWQESHPLPDVHPQIIDQNIVIGSLCFPITTERLDILQSRGSLAQLAMSALRYASVAGRSQYCRASQQWSIPRTVYEVLVHQGGADLEGFASPFNSQLLRWHRPFCSLFPDTDRPFGAIGSFFQTNLARRTVVVNPPFLPEFLDLVVERCLKFPTARFYIFVPAWTDAPFYQRLVQRATAQLVLPKHSYGLENSFGERILGPFAASMFVLGSLDVKAWSAIQEAWRHS